MLRKVLLKEILKTLACALLGVAIFSGPAFSAALSASSLELGFLPSDPVSEYLPVSLGEPDHGFCSQWNPEYGYRGKFCCSKSPVARGRRLPGCAPSRVKWTFCDEMTPEQKHYVDLVQAGASGDVLEILVRELRPAALTRAQAYCTVSSGFLVDGRALLGTPQNRIIVRNPLRCTSFGTDPMVAMLEWVGREIGKEYSSSEYKGVRLNVGDLSAPRGGCISGRRGRRAHASHTTGVDVDLGFLRAVAGQPEVNEFTKQFDPRVNLWFLKKLFKNPYACVKAVFLDRRLIAKLGKLAGSDPEWAQNKRLIKHVRGHRNHFHVRVGDAPGAPGVRGCTDLGSADDLEESEEEDLESEGGSEESLEGEPSLQPAAMATQDSLWLAPSPGPSQPVPGTM